jgi:TPR repeat protein
MATPVPLPAAGTSSADASPLANLRRNAVAQPPAAPNAVPPQHASLPPPPVTVPAPANDPAAVAVVIEQAELQISIGNVKAARTALEAAAKAGSLAATVALAATYDPLELAKVLVPPGTDDVQTAVKLYSEAAARGSRTARARLDRLLGATADEPGQSRPQQK